MHFRNPLCVCSLKHFSQKHFEKTAAFCFSVENLTGVNKWERERRRVVLSVKKAGFWMRLHFVPWILFIHKNVLFFFIFPLALATLPVIGWSFCFWLRKVDVIWPLNIGKSTFQQWRARRMDYFSLDKHESLCEKKKKSLCVYASVEI